MNSLDIIDKILEFLKNKVEAKANEVYKLIELDESKVSKLLILLEDMELIKVEEDKISITEIGLRFLELPTES